MRRALILLAGLVLAPGFARAGESASEPASRTLSLSWAAPQTCPRAEAVLSRVAKLIGQKVEPATNAELSVQAEVSFVRGSAFELRMSWGSDGGTTTRRLSAESCEEIVDAAALFIAFSLAPEQLAKEHGSDATAEGDSTDPSAAPTTSPTAPVKPSARLETSDASSPLGRDAASLPGAQPAPLHFALGAYSALWLARLPQASPGLVAFGGGIL